MAKLSGTTAAMLPIAALTDQVFFGYPKWSLITVLLFYLVRLLMVAGSFQDPAVLMMIFAAIYCAVPLALAIPGSAETFYLPLTGAAWIYVVGTIGLLAGVAVGALFLTPMKSHQNIERPIPRLKLSALLASICSIILSVVYVMQFGMAGFTHSYADSFLVRQSAGSGFLFLAVPLAAAGLCMILCSGCRISKMEYVVALAPYFFLFFAHGQRKFLIFPLIFVAAKRVKIRKPMYLVAGACIALPMFVAFQFVGFSRTTEQSPTISEFLDSQGDAMGGEAVPVFATAAAAAEEKVTALPLAGDYLLAPLMSLPQFLFGKQFLSLNDRFALWWKPEQAADGAGWGFSFFAEAYLVGGYAAAFLVPAALALGFRYIYVRGLGSSQTGTWAAISLSMLPYVFWFQRNAFAYLFREFGYQIAIIFLCVLITSSLRALLNAIGALRGVRTRYS